MWSALGALWLREADGRAIIDRAITEGRRQAAVSVLAQLLQLAARHDATADRWTAAAAGYHEAIALARDTGYGTDLAASLAGLAWLEARQGKEAECRAHAAEALALAAQLGIGTHHVWTLAALADLELGLGHLDLALEHLREQQAALDSLGHRRRRPLTRAGAGRDPRSGSATARRRRRSRPPYAAQATAKGQPWPRARAARCAGLLASDDELDARFGEALELHERTPDLFEQGANPSGLRRAPAPGAAARPRPRAATRGARDLRAPRRDARGSSRPRPSSPRPAKPPAGAT